MNLNFKYSVYANGVAVNIKYVSATRFHRKGEIIYEQTLYCMSYDDIA